MIYLATPSTIDAKNAMERGRLGAIVTPDSWGGANGVLGRFPWWAADNACFAKGDDFDADAWLKWLEILRPHLDACLFAVLPDVVGDAAATFDRSLPYAATVRDMGYAPALVVQEGIADLTLPIDAVDAVFIGGKTEAFKFGEGMAAAMEAKAAGLWTHMGRVNSFRRLRAATLSGIDSADGTYLTFGPDKNLPKLLHWLDWLDVHVPFHFGDVA